MKVKLLSRVQLCNPWTVAHQAPPSMGFPRQEYWSGLPFPFPGDLPDPGMKPGSPALEADTLTSEKTSYRDTELQIQVLTSKISREERKPGWKKKGEEAGERGKRGGLTDVSCHLQIPRHYGTLPWASREGRTRTWPYQKPDQNSVAGNLQS